MPFYAHTGIQPDRSDWQTLESHLQGVADLALDPSKINPFSLAPLKSPSWVPIPAKSILCSLWNSVSPNAYLCPKLGSKLGSTPPFPTHPITNPKGIHDVHAL